MEWLIEHKANIDFQDSEGETCLMLSATWGRVEAARLLLRHHAKVNLVDHKGQTALMHACSPEHYDEENRQKIAMELVRLLIAHGAAVSVENAKGQTAADLAAESELFKVEEFLRAQSSR